MGLICSNRVFRLMADVSCLLTEIIDKARGLWMNEALSSCLKWVDVIDTIPARKERTLPETQKRGS